MIDEFGLIKKIIDGSQKSIRNKGIDVIAGDDSCLLASLKHPVITTDTQREGVHFRFDWQTPEEVGKKAVAVTLSDLAASYARPVALFVNLGIPSYISDQMVLAAYKGVDEALAEYECGLGGGNISSAPSFSMDLFAVGEGRGDIFPLRSAARPGDGLYSTGPLGLARAGLMALEKQNIDYQYLIDCFKFPRARFDAAEILAGHRVKCVMDISDGLAGDASHIAVASGITIELVPVSGDFPPEFMLFLEQYKLSADFMAKAGGEDYELLFACPPSVFGLIRKDLPEAIQVGECRPLSGSSMIDEAKLPSSFQHG